MTKVDIRIESWTASPTCLEVAVELPQLPWARHRFYRRQGTAFSNGEYVRVWGWFCNESQGSAPDEAEELEVIMNELVLQSDIAPIANRWEIQ